MGRVHLNVFGRAEEGARPLRRASEEPPSKKGEAFRENHGRTLRGIRAEHAVSLRSADSH